MRTPRDLSFFRCTVLLSAALLVVASCASDRPCAVDCDEEPAAGASGGPIASGGSSAGSMASGGASSGRGGVGAAGGAAGASGAAGRGDAAGGSTAGSAGSSGAGGLAGSAGCGNTQTDWRNCGECGRVCSSFGADCEDRCCVAGECAPFVGSCLRQTTGFDTCAEACESVGEVCVARGCTVGSHVGVTWVGWDASIIGRCEVMEYPDVSSVEACAAPLTWGGAQGEKRCCCSDS